MTKFYLPMFHTGQVMTYVNILIHYYPQLLKEQISGPRRLMKGASLARMHVQFSQDLPGTFDVRSQTRKNRIYTVDPENRTCSCPDSRAGYVCKHRIAVVIASRGSDLAWKLQGEFSRDMPGRWEIESGKYLPFPRDEFNNPYFPGEEPKRAEPVLVPRTRKDTPANV